MTVSSVEEKKRRKALYGTACTGAREVLNAVAEDAKGLHLEDFEDTSAAVCFLCRSCDKTLTNILELEERLSHMKEKVKSFISSSP